MDGTITSATLNIFNTDEHAFDADAPPILPTQDSDGMEMGDPDDSFMGGVDMDIDGDNNGESDVVRAKY